MASAWPETGTIFVVGQGMTRDWMILGVGQVMARDWGDSSCRPGYGLQLGIRAESQGVA